MRPRRPWLLVLIALAVNHALILLGAWLLLQGSAVHRSSETEAGAWCVAAGVLLEIAVLVWAGSMAAWASVRRQAGAPSGSPAAGLARWRCPACGRTGPEVGRINCPTCGRVVVRLR